MTGEIKFTLSNLSLSPRMQAFAGAEEHAEYAAAVGADGYEITPTTITRFGQTALTRDLMSTAQGIENWAEENLKSDAVEDIPDDLTIYGNLIHSLHAAPRLRSQTGSGLNLLRRTVYPPYENSVARCLQIQRTLGRKVNAVLFPGYNVDSEKYHGTLADKFNARLIKPRTIGQLRARHEIENLDLITLQEIMAIEGADGIAWDTFDAMVQADDSNGRRASQRFLQLAHAGLIEAIHLGLGRTDYVSKSSPLARQVFANHTMASKEAFIESAKAAAQTVEGIMLIETVQFWRQADQAATPPRTITLQTYPSFRTSTEQTMAEHKAIIAHARDLVAAA